MSVRLKIAFNQVYAVSGMTTSWTTVAVKVKNIAADKQVDLIFKPHGSSGWVEAPLSFQSHHGTYATFGSNSSGSIESVESFAIRYRTAGAEFWDNNDGQDYHIGSVFSGAVGGNVILGRATAIRSAVPAGGSTVDTGWIEGEILVNNLAFWKRVGLVYTYDDGGTWHEVLASFLGPVKAVANNVAGVEIWRFRTPQLTIHDSASAYRFAVFHEHNGTTFWDNNYGQDYSLPKANGSHIE
ncbi:hypothetical protein WMF30_22075 [Sorangium sp. So ce134]